MNITSLEITQATMDAYNRRYEVSIKDELTGLYNRRGFETDCELIKKDKNLQNMFLLYICLEI